MNEYAAVLLDAVDTVVVDWVERCVASRATGLHDAARLAGETARAEIVDELRELFDTDIDEQRANPLAVMRRGVRFPAAVLTAAGVAPVVRPEFERNAFPDDIYGLSPATWTDVDESLREPGLIWGVSKAKEHLDRRRLEGRR